MSDSARAKRLVVWLWVGVALQLVGRAVDGRWHATHDEFETATDQLQAHWLIWIGVLATLAVSALAVRSRSAPKRAWRWPLAASLAYVVAAAWHFLEHAAGDDPAGPHVAVAVVWTALLASAVATTLLVRRGKRTPAGGAMAE